MSRQIVRRLKGPFFIFLYKKVLLLMFTFFFSLTLLFFIPRMLPSSPVEMMVARLAGGTGAGTSLGTESPSTWGTRGGSVAVEVIRQVYTEKFGLEQPTEIQFLRYWKRIFTWDYGPSYFRYPQKVMEVVMYALPWTLVLVVPVPVIGFFVGNLIGSKASYKKSKINRIIYFTTLYLSLIPYYWFALILVYAFAVVFKLFPNYGPYSDIWLYPTFRIEWLIDAAYHYVLPFFSILGVVIGGWAVGMRASILSQIRATYVEYSKQLGLSSKRIRKYIQRNAILPNFTWLPIAFSSLIGQTLLVEIVFGYPGIGLLMYQSAFALDYPMLEACFVILMLIVLTGNFLCDIAYGVLDPTIGSRYVSEGSE